MLIKTSNNEYTVLPSTTSKGIQEKWVVENKFFKLDSPSSFDSLAEALVSELEGYISDLSYVDYFLDKPKTIHGVKRRVCWSYNCLKYGESEITLYKVLRQNGDSAYLQDLWEKYTGKDRVLKVSELVEKTINYNPMYYFSRLVFLDSLTMNPDRHLNNISFKLLSSGKATSMPILDNGKALFSDASAYNLAIPIRKLRLEMAFSRPFSNSFKEQVSYFKEFSPLVIDIQSLLTQLGSIEDNIESVVVGERSERMLLRMIEILKLNLQDQEGITWIRK